MATPTWIIEFSTTEDTQTIISEGWQVGPNGDLVFGNLVPRQGVMDFVPVAAFAAGTWTEVRRYD